jgi:hypothetical protein
MCLPYHVAHLVDLQPGPFAVFWPFGVGMTSDANLLRLETSGVTSRFRLGFRWSPWSCIKGEGGRQPSFWSEGLSGNAFEDELRFRNLHGLGPASLTIAPRRWDSIPMSRSCDPCEEIPRSVTLARWGWTFAPLALRRVSIIRRSSLRCWKSVTLTFKRLVVETLNVSWRWFTGAPGPVEDDL